jgi:hypothetical protein
MLERYRMSERTFYTMIQKYSEAREIDDYIEDSRTPKLYALFAISNNSILQKHFPDNLFK